MINHKQVGIVMWGLLLIIILTSASFGMENMNDYTVEYNDLITHSTHRYNILVYPEYVLSEVITDDSTKYDFWFKVWSNEFGMPNGLNKEISRHESGLNPLATNLNKNGTTDYGMMQINSAYAQSYWDDLDRIYDGYYTSGVEYDWSNPCHNIMLGTFILSQNYRYYKNWDKAISSYNRGTGWTDENGMYWTYRNKIDWEE